jgi:hypothetical protein
VSHRRQAAADASSRLIREDAMNDKEKALVRKTATLLVGSNVKKVNFYFRAVPFKAAHYKYISECLSWSLNHSGFFGGLRGIGVKIKQMPPDTGAQYDDDCLVVPHAGFGDTHWEKMTLVHECTHACIDALYARNRIPRLFNEASAYLAGGLYNVHAAASADGPFGFTPTSGVYLAAHKLAIDHRKRSEANPHWGTINITEKAATDLLTAIKTSKTYNGFFDDPDETYEDDGIKF